METWQTFRRSSRLSKSNKGLGRSTRCFPRASKSTSSRSSRSSGLQPRRLCPMDRRRSRISCPIYCRLALSGSSSRGRWIRQRHGRRQGSLHPRCSLTAARMASPRVVRERAAESSRVARTATRVGKEAMVARGTCTVARTWEWTVARAWRCTAARAWECTRARECRWDQWYTPRTTRIQPRCSGRCMGSSSTCWSSQWHRALTWRRRSRACSWSYRRTSFS
mmetsp:Transcript_94497/g.211836  ORF Transcript_94497/g.211836 Transcript_94497/m.211836 type:complete len:222 (+) Transcript_94497:474-1139(+)